MVHLKEDSPHNQIPGLVKKLYRIVGDLSKLYPDRPFTPDGHLVGSLGEVIAAHKYKLELLPPSAETHDAKTNDGKLVQVKITQGKRVALRSQPDFLIVLKLHKDGTTTEIYNGRGRLPWEHSGKMQKNGQRPITFFRLLKLMQQVQPNEKI